MGVVELDMSSDASEHTKSAQLSLNNELAGSSSPYVSHARLRQGRTTSADMHSYNLTRILQWLFKNGTQRPYH